MTLIPVCSSSAYRPSEHLFSGPFVYGLECIFDAFVMRFIGYERDEKYGIKERERERERERQTDRQTETETETETESAKALIHRPIDREKGMRSTRRRTDFNRIS